MSDVTDDDLIAIMKKRMVYVEEARTCENCKHCGFGSQRHQQDTLFCYFNPSVSFEVSEQASCDNHEFEKEEGK